MDLSHLHRPCRKHLDTKWTKEVGDVIQKTRGGGAEGPGGQEVMSMIESGFLSGVSEIEIIRVCLLSMHALQYIRLFTSVSPQSLLHTFGPAHSLLQRQCVEFLVQLLQVFARE